LPQYRMAVFDNGKNHLKSILLYAEQL